MESQTECSKVVRLWQSRTHETDSSPYRADVIVPVYRDVAMTVNCLRSVLAHSGPELDRLIVINDVSPDAGMAAALEELAASDSRMMLLHNKKNLGFIGSINLGLSHRRGDVVLLNNDTKVTPGWLAELAAVCHTDDRTACVSPLTNIAPLCGVPELFQENSLELISAEKVQAATARLPRSTIMPVAVGFCLYMRGHVVDLIGGLDPIFGKGYYEENDWIMKAQAMGFIARRANRAFVYHYGSQSFDSAEKKKLNRKNEKLFTQRHPHFMPQVQRYVETVDSRLASHAVRVSCYSTLRVALDLRGNTFHPVGTNQYCAALARHLAARPDVDLQLLARDPRQVAGLPGRVRLGDQRIDGVEVIHRPSQVFDRNDLPLLIDSSAHTVISHLDLIIHRAPILVSSPSFAEDVRGTSYLSLQASQAVIAISDHAKSEIVAEYGLEDERVTVVPLGIDPERVVRLDNEIARSSAPRFFLCISTDYPHKNLSNLLQAYAQFRKTWHDGEPPSLVLVGAPTKLPGASYARLLQTPVPGVVYKGVMPDESIRDLFAAADALIVPSVYEGFGLTILEGMMAGVPVIALPLTSIPEVGGEAVLYPNGGRPEDLAHAMRQVIADRALRDSLIARGQSRARDFTWQKTVDRTLDVYRRVVSEPSEVSLLARRRLRELLSEKLPASSAAPQALPPAPPGILNSCQFLAKALKLKTKKTLARLPFRRAG